MNVERVATLQELLEKDPNDSLTRYAVAMQYAGHDDPAAIRTLEELVRRDETYAPACHQLGILYARANRTEEARMVFQKGISVARLQNDHHAAEEMGKAFNELRVS